MLNQILVTRLLGVSTMKTNFLQDIIRARKQPKYRTTLNEKQRSQLPENPFVQ